MSGRKGKAKVEVEGEDLPQPRECFCMGAGPQVSAALKMGSAKTREHFHTARVEFLKGLRNLIDSASKPSIRTTTQKREPKSRWTNPMGYDKQRGYTRTRGG